MHSRPSTTPIPVTIPALGASPSYRSHAASAFSSRKAVSGSTRRSIRSRAVSFPRERWRSTERSPPPLATCAVRSRSSATSSPIRSRRRVNSSDRSTWEVRTATESTLSGGVLFNSFTFLLLFLPLVAVGYFAVPQHRLRLLLIVGASYYFYAYADWWFPALMGGSTLISFTAGRILEQRRDKAVLAVGIAGVLSLLVWFKYGGFAGGYALDTLRIITGQ